MTDQSVKVLTMEEFMERESTDFSKSKKALQQLYRVYIKSQLEKYQVVNDKKSSSELRQKLLGHIENKNHFQITLDMIDNGNLRELHFSFQEI